MLDIPALRNLIYGQTSTSSAGLPIVRSASLPPSPSALCRHLSRNWQAAAQLRGRIKAARVVSSVAWTRTPIEVGRARRDSGEVANGSSPGHKMQEARTACSVYTSNGFARTKAFVDELFRSGASKTSRREEETCHLPSPTWDLSMTCLDSPVLTITKICAANQLPHPDITHALVRRPVEACWALLSYADDGHLVSSDEHVERCVDGGGRIISYGTWRRQEHPSAPARRTSASSGISSPAPLPMTSRRYRIRGPRRLSTTLIVAPAYLPPPPAPRSYTGARISPADIPLPCRRFWGCPAPTGHKETVPASNSLRAPTTQDNDPHTTVIRTTSTRPLASSNRGANTTPADSTAPFTLPDGTGPRVP
ncbi:hypothetical protein R3P38DRAFT_3195895 [Favolaschia claudopus]|uniref:Uncharacterized protein n=1 Tax=Favolaschia claudopus TaxID=2862362 RepID=A0AAW0B9L4_9AGAR